MAYAIDAYSGEYLCPCEGSDTKYVSLMTGQIYCVIDCSGEGGDVTVWNPYDLQQYCVCE